MATTEEKAAPDFTIGMACFDNFEEVYFTVQVLRFYHPELIKRFELVVVDNNPHTRDGKAVKALIEGRVRDVGRYVEFPEPKGSVPPRGHLIDVARGKFVICIDSHVLLAPGCLQSLADYFDKNPKSDDFIQGPLLSNYGPHRIEGSHMNPRWRSAMFGTWGVDDRCRDIDGPAFDIPQHGLGLFAVRRESWLRFHPDMKGFSGGEGYIHEKYRQAGRRCLCLPAARWYHKFARPAGIPHRPNVEDKIRNHVKGWMELGVDLQTGKTDDPIRSIATHYIYEKKLLTAERFSELVADCGYPDYIATRPEIETESGAIIGPTSWGSFKMRGKPLASATGFRVLNTRGKIELEDTTRFDTVLAVKCDVPKDVRSRTARVICDPMDYWFDRRKEHDKTPAKFIADFHARNKFDDLICSTIPMKSGAARGLPHGVRAHLVPHHADVRVKAGWHDPAGPIVYAGCRSFVLPAVEALKAAAAKLGREIVFDTHPTESWKSLEGAALILTPRIGSAFRLNREGKPTIKVANATQAGIPVLSTDCPAIATLFPDIRTAPAADWIDVDRIAAHLGRALNDEPSAVQFPYAAWLGRMKGILGCE